MLSKTIYTRDFAVATEHYLASLAAYDVLKKGGNAFDSTIAASFSLTVLQPHLNGLGGDFFAMVYNSGEDKIYCLNSSGWYYKNVNLDNLEKNGIPLYGPFSSVVPGYVKGICSLHKKFATLELKDLMKYAINYAEKGFPITDKLSRSIKNEFGTLLNKGFIENVLDVSGGYILKQKNLAKALKEVEESGSDAFYKGKIAKNIIEELREKGLEAIEEDFSQFKEEWIEPISIEYGGKRIFEFPPNSMGATTLLILKLLSIQDLRKYSPNSEERILKMINAAKIAYKRTDEMIGDPRFVKFDIEKYLDISNIGTSFQLFKKSEGDTTYFAIVDKYGNLVSAIQSLFHYFGSKVYIKDYGFFLNNRASAFSTKGPNKLEPRKRPLHTLSTLMIGEEIPTMAIGTSGGNFRPQQHSIFVTNILDYGMKINEAIDFPRFLLNGDNSVIIEEGLPSLNKHGFLVNFEKYPGRTGVAQAIEIKKEYKVAVCDVRGDGFPMGE